MFKLHTALRIRRHLEPCADAGDGVLPSIGTSPYGLDRLALGRDHPRPEVPADVVLNEDVVLGAQQRARIALLARTFTVRVP